MSQREAESAKELLITRLMTVHPEVYGGGKIIPDLKGTDGNSWLIEVELSEGFPKHVKPCTEFMGYRVVYRITGWKPELMPYQENLPNA
jgi:hypothetical protein